MARRLCPQCGGAAFEQGFIDDAVQGRVRWFAGRLQIGMFGNAKRSGRPKLPISALRCATCSRLELFAGEFRDDLGAGPGE